MKDYMYLHITQQQVLGLCFGSAESVKLALAISYGFGPIADSKSAAEIISKMTTELKELGICDGKTKQLRRPRRLRI